MTTNEWSGTIIIDEIERLFVAYEKAKEYLSKITTGIEQQIDIWLYRQQTIREQLIQTKSSSSYDFLLPKTQRINELTVTAVEALCRVDLLIEQITRIDPKSRLSDTDVRQPISFSIKPPAQTPLLNGRLNGPTPLPVPVLRSQQPTPSARFTQEKTSFKPIVTQQQQPPPTRNTPESIARSPSIHAQYSTNEGLQFPRPSYGNRTPLVEQPASSSFLPPPPPSTTNQFASNYQPRLQQQSVARVPKEKVQLQRIPPGTKWKQARIDIIDSLSGFYVTNLDPKVHDKFLQMQDELHEYYNDLEKSNQLMPLDNPFIGDFGVAKYSEDHRWYRARLITAEEDDQIKIVFIDFGNIELKSKDEFFPLYKLFTTIPAQAIACSLSQAFPRSQNENSIIWPEETIEIFKEEVIDKIVEVYFVNHEEGTEQWPLHFVNITVNNQSVANLLSLQQRIDPRPNRFIAEHMAPSFNQQEYILFNVPSTEDEFEQ